MLGQYRLEELVLPGCVLGSLTLRSGLVRMYLDTRGSKYPNMEVFGLCLQWLLGLYTIMLVALTLRGGSGYFVKHLTDEACYTHAQRARLTPIWCGMVSHALLQPAI